MAAAIAVAVSAPFIIDQITLTALRAGGTPLVIAPVSVLGDAVPQGIRGLLDLPAYWLVYLPIEFPAFYLAGLIGAFALLRDCKLDRHTRQIAHALTLLAAVSLVTAWLLRSVIADERLAPPPAERWNRAGCATGIAASSNIAPRITRAKNILPGYSAQLDIARPFAL